MDTFTGIGFSFFLGGIFILLVGAVYLVYKLFTFTTSKWYETQFKCEGRVVARGLHRQFFVGQPVVWRGVAYIVSSVGSKLMVEQLVSLRRVVYDDLFKINGDIAKDISSEKFSNVSWRDKI